MLKQQLDHGGVHNEYTQHVLYLMSPQAPYVPLGPRSPPASETEVAGMFKKLAARANPSVQVSHAAQSPQEKSDLKLEWHRPVSTGPGSGYMLSVCDRYRIDKCCSQESKTYTAWRRATVRNHLSDRLGIAEDAKGAAALCQAHADREGK